MRPSKAKVIPAWGLGAEPGAGGKPRPYARAGAGAQRIALFTPVPLT